MRKRLLYSLPMILFLLGFFAAKNTSAVTPKLANPATVNCVKQGGQPKMEKRGDGGEYGICIFEDNRQCEEWALLHGDCPKGGVKITGYDTPEQIYCAISGGKPLADPKAKCTFANGAVCTDQALYQGQCSKNTAETQSNPAKP